MDITYLKDYRAPNYLINKTQLLFELGDDATLVSNTMTFYANPSAQGENSLFLHGEGLELLSIQLDGKALGESDYHVSDTGLQLSNLPTKFTLHTQVKIHPQHNTELEGLYLSNGMYCTQCEAEGFRKITYYPDRPDVMAEFEVTLIAADGAYTDMLSNGNCISDVVENGQRIVKWHDPFKKPSYLFALVAGNLSCLEDSFTTASGREVLLQIYSAEKDIDKCHYAMDSLKRAMLWDEQQYGREYDLDRYMVVAVDHFNMGAMENKGLNVFNTSCVLADPKTTTDQGFQRVESVVAHEYFHNWSGNRVTCRDWFQLSLKEGLTVYRDAEFSADMNSRAVKRIEDVSLLRSIQFVEDAGPMAHSVRPGSYMEISNFYTFTIYEKGAEVVRMLANILGAEQYRKGCDLYFERFDGQAVTCDDFVACMEEVSGLDLSQFKLWYSQAGTPELHIKTHYDAAAKHYRMDIKQSIPDTAGQANKKAMHIPLKLALVGESGLLPLVLNGENLGNEVVLDIKEAEQSYTFEQLEGEPSPSFLREFSAPVKLFYPYSVTQLQQLIMRDSDGFCRWDAMQQFMLYVLHGLMDGQSVASEQQGLIECLGYLLKNYAGEDKALVARLLELPAESYIASFKKPINPKKVSQAKQQLQHCIAQQLETHLLQCYQDLSGQIEGMSAEAMAARSLRNVCLSYLSLNDQPQYGEIAWQQLVQANTMSDQFSALKALVHSPHFDDLAEKALADFYQQWQGELLVGNMWLQVQASKPNEAAISRVQELLEHPAYDAMNPNKVRALLAAFSQANYVGFHLEDGSAYQFLAEQIIAIDQLNPQIASRLLTPLTQWKQYNEHYAELMRHALLAVKQSQALSADVKEVLEKSLSVA